LAGLLEMAFLGSFQTVGKKIERHHINHE